MKAQVEGETNPWKFASGFYDSSTGLYHFGARYYDPSLGRWTQQDPVAGSLGDMGSADRYMYANDNPVNFVDPSGASVTLSCLFGFVGSVLGALGSIGATVLSFIAAGQAYSGAYAAAIASGATDAAATAAAEAAAIVPFGLGVFALLIAAGAIFLLIAAILSCNGQ